MQNIKLAYLINCHLARGRICTSLSYEKMLLKYILIVLLGFNFSVKSDPCTRTNAQQEIKWILSKVLPTGVMIMNGETGGWVVPYNANLALSNILKIDSSRETSSKVFSYINWYLKHLNWPDKFGVYGTIYDYDVSDNGRTEKSKDDYDSSDSYGATFLSLVSRWARTNWRENQQWVKDHNYVLNAISDASWATFQPSIGLTYAKPNYRVAYLMDNVEVWRGMQDFSELMFDTQDYPKAIVMADRANAIRKGIEKHLWNPQREEYSSHYGNTQPTNWTQYYPDVMANLFPQIFGLPEGLESGRRSLIYNKFKQNDRGRWTSIDKPNFPHGLPSEAAKRNGDNEFIKKWMKNVDQKWLPSREWTYFIGDASLFTLRLYDTEC